MDHLEPSVRPTVADDEAERAVHDLFREVEHSGELPAGVPAYSAVDTVLCALEMRLPRTQAEELEDEVPPTLRALISRCVIHRTDRPEISFDEPAFLRLIASALDISMDEAERVTRAVFTALQQRLPEHEIFAVRRRLPRDLNALWYPLAVEPGLADEDVRAGARPVEEPIETVLREIEKSGVVPDELSATETLQAVLCTLSRELTGHEAQELADASRTLRRLLAPCVRHRDERPHVMDRPTFLRAIEEHLGVDERRAERIAQTVFAALRGRLPPDEVRIIDGRIPRSVRSLWNP